MIRTGLWSLALLGVLLVFQTTLLSPLVLWGVKPDVLLIVFVVLATFHGSVTSQLVGFVLGLAIDSVTTAPWGYHAFVFALAGYLFGLGSGKVYFDPVFMPALLGFLATLYSTLTGWLLNQIFQLGQPVTAFFHVGLLLQLVLNMALGPLVFWLYGVVKARVQNPRRGFGG